MWNTSGVAYTLEVSSWFQFTNLVGRGSGLSADNPVIIQYPVSGSLPTSFTSSSWTRSTTLGSTVPNIYFKIS
jgi:hypothetical protein